MENNNNSYYQPDYGFQPPVKESRSFSPADSVLAWLCFIGAYIFCRLFPATSSPLGGFIFILAAYITTFVFLFIKGHRPTPLPAVIACSAIVISSSLVFSSNGLLHFLSYGYALCSLSYVIYAAAGNRLENRFSALIAIDYFKALILMPIRSLHQIFRAAFTSRSTRKPVLKALAGIGIAMIPTAIIAGLLSYDDRFRELMNTIIRFDIASILSYIGTLFFAVPVSMYFYGTFISAFDGEMKDTVTAQGCRNAGQKIRFVSPITVVAAVIPVLFLYVVFFISQWQYYISAFTGVLPDDLSFADYARSGFFQLCAVSVINVIIIAVVIMFIRHSPAVTRIITVLFSLSTLILIATALSKMVLYIDEYGLTQKRVYASWFMVVIALTFIVITLSQFIPGMSALAWSGAVFVIMFAVIGLSNVDGIIAKYNVDAYLSEKLDDIDVHALNELGDAAVPQLVRLYRASAEHKYIKHDLQERYYPEQDGYHESQDDSLFSMTLPKLQAIQAMKSIGIK